MGYQVPHRHRARQINQGVPQLRVQPSAELAEELVIADPHVVAQLGEAAPEARRGLPAVLPGALVLGRGHCPGDVGECLPQLPLHQVPLQVAGGPAHSTRPGFEGVLPEEQYPLAWRGPVSQQVLRFDLRMVL